MKKKSKKLTERQKFARLGGRAIARKRGKRGMRALGKKGAQARWNKKP